MSNSKQKFAPHTYAGADYLYPLACCRSIEMVKNKRKLHKFYLKLEAEEKLSYRQAVRIYDALHKEAVALGAISHENIWDGFEVDLRISRAINGLARDRKTAEKNSSKVGRR